MNKAKSKEECIKLISRFPLTYSESGLSPKEIVKQSMYKKYRDEISIDDIANELKRDEKLIDYWLNFTEAKRWTPAWGIAREGDSYLLFYVFRNGQSEIKQSFRHSHEACARMVRMEMEGLLDK